MTCFRTHFFCFIGKPVLSLLLVLCPFLSSQAVTKEFVLRFHFRLDNARYETAYMDNDVAENALSSFLRKVSPESIQDVRVTAYASPESSLSYNEELCGNRLNAMRSLINSRFPQLSSKTSYVVGGEAWDMVRQRVKADASLKRRSPETYKTITDILDDPSITNDTRKELLKSRLPKNWYGYLRWIHYHEVRFCEVWIRYKDATVEQSKPQPEPETEPVTFAPLAQTPKPVILQDTVHMTKKEAEPALYAVAPAVIPEDVIENKKDSLEVTSLASARDTVKVQQDSTKKTILAVKTNLLYDAASMLNYAVEVPIGDRFSLVWEHYFPWWVFRSNRICIQYLTLGGEARWWFAPQPRPATEKRARRDRLVGHYLGLYGFWGKTDLQWDKIGCYQCDNVISAGLTYGFVFPITRHLNMELSLSAGYVRIHYQHYLPSEDWQILWKDYANNGFLHFFGPTKLQVSLVWPIQINKRQNHSAREGAAR